MKITNGHRRDFKAYVLWHEHCMKQLPVFNPFQEVLVSEGKLTALECFVKYDSQGKRFPCCEPQLLQAALEGKNLLNFHIKMWAESYYENLCLIYLDELKTEFPFLPEWVWEAIPRLAYKVASPESKTLYKEWLKTSYAKALDLRLK